MTKVGRNDPCPCGSGKKFKKCCEAKMSRKSMSERKIENQTAIQKSAGLSDLFKSHITPSSQNQKP